MTTTPVAEVVDQLRVLGLAAGDTVMVHASMRRLGPIEDGALGLIAALDAAIAPGGTLLMMAGPSEDEGTEPFDAYTAPVDADVGVLAEVFRTAPGTVVNDHPEGRFAARGARAHELLDDPPWDDYYGPGSPLHRRDHAGGSVLRLGSDLDTMTVIHYAEYLADVPGKRRVTRHRLVAGDDGPVMRSVSCLDDSLGIVERDEGEEDYFATITRGAIAAGLARTGAVGGATCELLEAGPFVEFASRWMTEHLGPCSA